MGSERLTRPRRDPFNDDNIINMTTIITPKPGEPFGLWVAGSSILHDTVVVAGAQAGAIDHEKSGAITWLDWNQTNVVAQEGVNTHWLVRLRNLVGRAHGCHFSALTSKVVEHGWYVNMGGSFIGTKLDVDKVGGQAWQSCFRPDETLLPVVHPRGSVVLVLFRYADVGNQESGVGGGASFAMSFFASGQRIHLEHLLGSVELPGWKDWAGNEFRSRGALFVGAEYPWTNGRKPWFAHQQVGKKWYATEYTTPGMYLGFGAVKHAKPDRAVARLEGIEDLLVENFDFGDEGHVEIDRPDLDNDPRCDLPCGRVRLFGCTGKAELRYAGKSLGPIGAFKGTVGVLEAKP